VARHQIAVVKEFSDVPSLLLEPRLFTHGFTTRENGRGFGLHSCALAAKEMAGTITAHSDGPGRGAAFTLELPFNPA
jgi:two-component system, NtrC family, sensor kinase